MILRGQREFRSDGCSGGMSALWRLATGGPPPWERCCVQHDRRYWEGGPRAARLLADMNLRWCVVQRGHPYWARAIYWAVRVGGHPLLPTPWRWGFSRPWPSPYSRQVD